MANERVGVRSGSYLQWVTANTAIATEFEIKNKEIIFVSDCKEILIGNGTDAFLDLYNKKGSRVHSTLSYMYNSTVNTIPIGKVVQRSSQVEDGVPGFELFDNTVLDSIAGLTLEDASTLQEISVISKGMLFGIDLSGFTVGDTLYADLSNLGELTNTPDVNANFKIHIGTVVDATVDGALFVDVKTNNDGFITNSAIKYAIVLG